MPLLGDVFLDTVYAETPDSSVRATDHPIESGVDITDHVEKQPKTMDISGICTGPDAAKRLGQLKSYLDNGVILTYSYRNIFNNVIISDLKTTHDKDVLGAFKFDISLKQILIAKTSIIKALKLPQRVQAKPVTNKGVQQKQTIVQAKAPKPKPKIVISKTPGRPNQTFVGDNRHKMLV